MMSKQDLSKADQLVQVVEYCLRLDNFASRIYQMLTAHARNDHFKSFWKQIAEQNEQNVFYWNRLRILADNGLISNLFPDCEHLLGELSILESKIKKLAIRCEGLKAADKAFAAAFKLEFYLLHPAFETLHQCYRASGAVAISPYDRHINTLFDAMHEQGLASLELELPGEILHRLWQENRKMAILNHTDELTGILNRRGLFQAINHLGHLCQRSDLKVGVLMIDIDQFKKINENHGQPVGDAVLKYVAATVKNMIRSSDAVGRFGGEEFLVFLTRIEHETLQGVAEKIRKSIAQGNGGLPPVAVSIGGACDKITRSVDQCAQLLVQLAEKNLIRAKRAGRDCVCV
jgi:diguanylate cyclase (GGDEF)-like protein